MTNSEATAKLYQGLELILEVFPVLFKAQQEYFKQVDEGKTYSKSKEFDRELIEDLQDRLGNITSEIEGKINDLLED